MLKNNNLSIGLVFFFCFFITNNFAQSEISSPYSGYGAGILTNTTNIPMASMGGLSYAMQNNLYINYKNPASYIAFDSLSFIADAGFFISSNNLVTNTQTQKGSLIRLSYLMIGLPVTKHWRTSAGIIPFSDIGYKILDPRKDLDLIYTYEGSGGLMQLYWGNAFRLAKDFSFGLNISYMFGSMNNSRFVEFSQPNFLNSRLLRATSVDGIYLSAGLQYFINMKNHNRLGLGLVYENSAYIWARESLLINNYLGTFNASSTYDTVLYKPVEKGRMIIPQTLGFGISFSHADKILVGADVSWQNWNNFKVLERVDSLKDAIVTVVGLQYTPDPLSGKYYKKIRFRTGAKFSTGYMRFQNTPIQEFSVSFGVGFPLRTFTSQSSVHIMFEYGQMGTTKNDLIRQNSFKVSFGFVLHEKWYQRVKLE
jgi:hypothetical protein